MNSLIVGIIAGSLGMAYWVYGRRQARFAPMIAGVLLCVYPYFVDGWFWLILVGAVLAAAPFVTDF
ncbi:MAG: hypothetical protein V1809_05275 [Planctomycetota bacterium]